MKALSFQKREVSNPNTGETSIKLAVKFDNLMVFNLLLPDGESIDSMTEKIRADRQTYLDKVQVYEGEFGKYCRFSNAKLLEEI